MMKPEEYMCEHSHNGLSHRKCYLRYIESNEPDAVGFLDIETNQLNAEFGFIISWAVKPQGNKTVYDYIKKKDFNNDSFDKRIVSSLLKELKKYKVIYTYYGARFDIPFLRTRAMKHGLDFPLYGSIVHRDLYFITRNKLKLVSNRLANVTKFFGIEGKTALDGSIWARAAYGHRKSIEYIVKHNQRDVEILEKYFERIKPYMSRQRTSI